jgi:hypothetical protein
VAVDEVGVEIVAAVVEVVIILEVAVGDKLVVVEAFDVVEVEHDTIANDITIMQISVIQINPLFI